MNNSSVWLQEARNTINLISSWSFKARDINNRAVIVEWKAGNITSVDLSEFKQQIADLGAVVTAATEVQFLQKYPEAAHTEMFLKPCEDLLEHGANNVDWDLVEERIRSTIKQFYLTDITKFGESVIKMLIDDLYFFGLVKEEATGKLLGFVMFSITPALADGDIKLINLVVDPQQAGKGLEGILAGSMFKLLPNIKRIFTGFRVTNTHAMQVYSALGFVRDLNPFQDAQHLLNMDYYMVMEYQAANVHALQDIATSLD